MALCLFGLLVSLWTYVDVDALSVCTPVDSIFILSSDLIEQSQEHIGSFFHDIVYEASSELSGVGVLAFGDVAGDFENPLLGLTETIGANTAHSLAAISEELSVDEVRDAALKGHISLTQAITSAHELFEAESAGREMEAIFVLDLVNDDSDGAALSDVAMSECIAATQQIEAFAQHSNGAAHLDYVEGLYYVRVDEEMEVVHIFDCFTQSEIEHTHSGANATSELHQLTCPSEFQIAGAGTVTLSGKVQLIELGSILSCDLIQVESSCSMKFELDAASTITVIDDANDNMSYEEGYILMATPNIFKLLPAECYVPVMVIEAIEVVSEHTKLHEDGESYIERQLRLNVVMPEDEFKYISDAHIHHATNHSETLYVKPDADLIAQEAIQEARHTLIARRRRRRLWGWFEDNIAKPFVEHVVEPVVEHVIEPVVEAVTDVIEFLDDGFNAMLGCLPNFDIEAPSFDLPCTDSGCSFTIALSAKQEFSAEISKSDNTKSVTGSGEAELEMSASFTVNFAVQTYGPDFNWDLSISDLGVRLYGSMQFEVNAGASASGTVSFEWDGVTKKLTKKPIVSWIGIVPVVWWPQVGVGLEGEVSNLLALEANYHYVWSADWAVGARIRNGDIEKISSFEQRETTTNVPVDASQFMDALASIPSCQSMPFRFAFPISIGIEFYLAVYPHITFTPALSGEINALYGNGCSTSSCSGVPTGVKVESYLDLGAGIGISAGTIGETVSCLFSLPALGIDIDLWNGKIEFDDIEMCSVADSGAPAAYLLSNFYWYGFDGTWYDTGMTTANNHWGTDYAVYTKHAYGWEWFLYWHTDGWYIGSDITWWGGYGWCGAHDLADCGTYSWEFWDGAWYYDNDAIMQVKSEGECCGCVDAVNSAGCPSDSACEAAVCAADPYCCSTAWDQICVDYFAVDICAGNSFVALPDTDNPTGAFKNTKPLSPGTPSGPGADHLLPRRSPAVRPRLPAPFQEPSPLAKPGNPVKLTIEISQYSLKMVLAVLLLIVAVLVLIVIMRAKPTMTHQHKVVEVDSSCENDEML